jgi:glutamyl-tRNA synthetase
MLNYLSRLGWSHGDDEVFSMEQMCSWFNLDHLSKSPAQFNPEKLDWLNNHYIKQADNQRLAALVKPVMPEAIFEGAPALDAVIALLKERANTTVELANSAMLFYREPKPDPQLLTQHLTTAVRPALQSFVEQCADVAWTRAELSALMKSTLAAHALKMPQLAMPLRLLVTGQLQTPSIDAVLELFGRDVVVKRIKQGLGV